MSSDVFILPAQARIAASGSNKADTRGPAAFKSNPLDKSSGPGEDFSATLKRISDRPDGSKTEPAPAEKPARTPGGSNTDPASTQKKSGAADIPGDHSEQIGAPETKEVPWFIHPLQAFNLMFSHLVDASMMDGGAPAVEAPSGSATGPGLMMHPDLIGHLHLQQQPATEPPLSIGPFEQLQASISAEATTWNFFEQMALKAGQPQDSAGLQDRSARLLAFWHRIFASASTAQQGAINGQPDSPGIHMPGMAGAAGDTSFDNRSLPDSKIAAGSEGARLNLNEALLNGPAIPSTSAQTGVSENARMNVSGHDGRLSSWAGGNSTSDSLPAAQVRQMGEDVQPLKIQEVLKADAEQPAQTNTAAQGVAAKTPEELFGIKSAVQKGEMPTLDVPGTKISQIDGDGRDSSFLFSHDQMPQHPARLENGTAASEAAQRSMMSQTLDQIVQRAVLSLNNGQHEVELHLKPDFLGNIRMQIVSEGQHVAIKMVAELPFVKDILENNLHQLKAELQSQGLDIEELEVSVAHDSHAERDVHQNAEAAKHQAVQNGADSDNETFETSGQTQTGGGGATGETAIDYFA